MKVCAISRDGLYLRLGESQEQSRWYAITKRVLDVSKTLKRGDTVDIKFEQREDGKFYLTELTKTGSAPAEEKKYYGKSPEEQNTIRRQAIGHMASRALIALQGQVDINNITNVAETLYKKFQELVESK
jgi:hypothetical protein